MIFMVLCAIAIIGCPLALSCFNFAHAFMGRNFKITRALLGFFWSLVTATMLVIVTINVVNQYYENNVIMEVNVND